MKERFSELASKVLSGEAGVEEKRQFRELIAENSEYALIYNQLKEYWDADVQTTSGIDKEHFAARVMSRLGEENEEVILRPRLGASFRKWASAAAILFFISTCTLLYLYVNVRPDQVQTYAAQSVPVMYSLEDGTTVKLNQNSSITLGPGYGSDQRHVILSGEAFFDVTEDRSRPFVVEAEGTQTIVLGTRFNVRATAGNVTATLVEGSILFTSGSYNEILRPGEEIQYYTSTATYKRYATDTQYSTAWVSGRFNYVGITFGQLVGKLEEIYQLDIQLSDEKMASRIVSASFLVDEPAEGILEALEEELGFRYVKEDSTRIRIIGLP